MIDLTEGNGKKLSLGTFALRYSFQTFSFIFFKFNSVLFVPLYVLCFNIFM